MVVLLIAISATFVVLNLERDTDALAHLETERFARLIEQAREESIVSGRAYAVSVAPDQHYYEFLQYRRSEKDGNDGEGEADQGAGTASGEAVDTGSEGDDADGAWVPVEDDHIFRRREIPVDLNVIFQLLEGSGKSGLLVVDGLGEITPFNFMIEGDSRVYAARLDDSLNVTVSDVTPD